MSAFITLPSGLRINTAHILHYRYIRESDSVGYTRVTLSESNEDGLPFQFDEPMTAAELDALLSPSSSPIVDSVVNLDKLKHGAGCQFTFEGVVRHGIVDRFEIAGDGEFLAVIISNGETFYIPTT